MGPNASNHPKGVAEGAAAVGIATVVGDEELNDSCHWWDPAHLESKGSWQSPHSAACCILPAVNVHVACRLHSSVVTRLGLAACCLLMAISW